MALRWGGAPGRRCTHTPTPSLTLLGGDAGVPLTLRSPVGHGLEAAGAYGVASLQGAHVVLGCGTDRLLRMVLPALEQQHERLSPHLEGQLQDTHEDTDLQENLCLENPTDRGAWQATVHWVAKSRTRLSN